MCSTGPSSHGEKKKQHKEEDLKHGSFRGHIRRKTWTSFWLRICLEGTRRKTCAW